MRRHSRHGPRSAPAWREGIAQAGNEIFGAVKPVSWIFVEGALQDERRLFWYFRFDMTNIGRTLLQMHALDLIVISGLKGQCTRQRLIGRDRECIYVAGGKRADRLLTLLRRHVGIGAKRFMVRPSQCRAPSFLGNTEVDQISLTIVGADQNVVRFDVAVHQTLFVQVIQRTGDLAQNRMQCYPIERWPHTRQHVFE